MRSNAINWHQHNRNYELSGLSVREYCAKAGINVNSFQNKRQQMKKSTALVRLPENSQHFVEYHLESEIKITVNHQGLVSLHGLSPENIPAVLRALHVIRQ